jgi:hypothetical protein
LWIALKLHGGYFFLFLRSGLEVSTSTPNFLAADLMRLHATQADG